METIDELAPILNYSVGIPPRPPDNREPRKKDWAIYMILTSVLLERVAFYTIVANLTILLQKKHLTAWNFEESFLATIIFAGIAYVSTLLFATISDAKIGRSKTIQYGFIFYIIGYSLITAISSGDKRLCGLNPSPDSSKCHTAIIVALVITALGDGAVKSNMVVFGAEQIEPSQLGLRYFDKYVFVVNIGSIIGTCVIPFIPDNSPSYIIMFSITTGLSLLAAAVFFFGHRHKYFIEIPSDETVLCNCIPVFFNAIATRCRHRRGWQNIASNSYTLDSFQSSVNNYNISSRISLLDYAKTPNNGKYQDRIVDNVKSLGRAVVVFFLLLPYWLIYNQLSGSFYEQGKKMHGGNDKSVVLVALGDPIVIVGIVLISILRSRSNNGPMRSKSIFNKLLFGMIGACVTMIIAGTAEIFRQRQYPPSFETIPSNNVTSSMSVFWQIPQSVSMGLAEVGGTIGSYEYAYYAAPRSGQTLFMSLLFFSAGVSSFIDYGYLKGFQSRVSNFSFSCPHGKCPELYIYFYLLAGIQLFFLIVFYGCQKKFRIVDINKEKAKYRS